MIVGAFTAIIVSALLQPLAGRVGMRWGLVDIPNHRSSHTTPTPRTGGLAVTVAILVGSSVSALTYDPARSSWWVLIVIVAFGLLGMVDDRVGLRAGSRLVVQSVLALVGIGVLALVGPWWSSPAALVWVVLGSLLLVAYVNAFNFMDGVNGISGLNAAVSGAYLAALMAFEGLGTLSVIAAVVTGAALGFLPWNVPRARIFLGDAGSYSLGGAIALIVVLGIANGVNWLFCLAAVMVYGLDTGVTLLARANRHEPLFAAHRDHIYQRLLSSGWGHLGAASATAAGSALVCAWALGVAFAGWSVWWTVPCMVAVAVIYLELPAISRTTLTGATHSRAARQDGNVRQGDGSGA